MGLPSWSVCLSSTLGILTKLNDMNIASLYYQDKASSTPHHSHSTDQNNYTMDSQHHTSLAPSLGEEGIPLASIDSDKIEETRQPSEYHRHFHLETDRLDFAMDGNGLEEEIIFGTGTGFDDSLYPSEVDQYPHSF